MNESIAAAILGVVQGFTEFLPVSSSGHLVLLQRFLPVAGDEVAFDLALHLGTLVPVLWVYREHIQGVIRDALGGSEPFQQRAGVRLALWVVLGTIPTGAIGVAFQDVFEALFSNYFGVAAAFAITGTMLYCTRWAREGAVDERTMHWWQALVIGIGQGLAITPGISRSGTTIAIALFLGLRREYAARFSFLLAIPAILGAVVLKVGDLDPTQVTIAPLAVGTLCAAVSGYFALVVLIRVVKAGSFVRFAYYLWPLAIFALVLALSQASVPELAVP